MFPSSIANNLASIPEFHTYQLQTSVFQEVAAYDRISPGFNLIGERSELIQGIHVTEGYFVSLVLRLSLAARSRRRKMRPTAGRSSC